MVSLVFYLVVPPIGVGLGGTPFQGFFPLESHVPLLESPDAGPPSLPALSPGSPGALLSSAPSPASLEGVLFLALGSLLLFVSSSDSPGAMKSSAPDSGFSSFPVSASTPEFPLLSATSPGSLVAGALFFPVLCLLLHLPPWVVLWAFGEGPGPTPSWAPGWVAGPLGPLEFPKRPTEGH